METASGTKGINEHNLRELEDMGRQLTLLQQRFAAVLEAVKGSAGVVSPTPQPVATAPQPPASQPVPPTPQPAAVAPQPVTPTPQPQAPKPTPAAPITPPAQAAQPTTLLDAILQLLRDDGKAMTFDEVFAELKKRQVPLPADKPMLAIRKLLYANKSIKVQRGGLKGGLFTYAPPA